MGKISFIAVYRTDEPINPDWGYDIGTVKLTLTDDISVQKFKKMFPTQELVCLEPVLPLKHYHIPSDGERLHNNGIYAIGHGNINSGYSPTGIRLGVERLEGEIEFISVYPATAARFGSPSRKAKDEMEREKLAFHELCERIDKGTYKERLDFWKRLHLYTLWERPAGKKYRFFQEDRRFIQAFLTDENPQA